MAHFATFGLYGSLPVERIFPPETLTGGETFLASDRLLDRALCGLVFLRQPEMAAIVVDAIKGGEDRFPRYGLHVYVVMPNRVDMLVTPRVTADRWLGPLKGFSAHEANRTLNRGGRFCQDESCDHLVRGEDAERIHS